MPGDGARPRDSPRLRLPARRVYHQLRVRSLAMSPTFIPLPYQRPRAGEVATRARRFYEVMNQRSIGSRVQ